MSGLEIVGAVASIIQVADAGLRISQTVYTYVDSVKSSDKRLKDVADHLKVTSEVVRHVAELFQDDGFGKNVGGKEISTANECVSKCNEAFSEVEDYVERAKTSKWRFPLREKKLDLLNVRLEQLKSSLYLMLGVIKNKNDIKTALERKEQRLQSDERLLDEIKTLRENRDRRDAQYEQCRRDLIFPDNSAEKSSTAASIVGRGLLLNAALPASGEPTSPPIADMSKVSLKEAPLDYLFVPPLKHNTGRDSTSSSHSVIPPNFLETGPTAAELEICSNHIQELLNKIQSMQTLMKHRPVPTLPNPLASQLYVQYCVSDSAWERTMTRHHTFRKVQMGSWHRNMASCYDKLDNRVAENDGQHHIDNIYASGDPYACAQISNDRNTTPAILVPDKYTPQDPQPAHPEYRYASIDNNYRQPQASGSTAQSNGSTVSADQSDSSVRPAPFLVKFRRVVHAPQIRRANVPSFPRERSPPYRRNREDSQDNQSRTARRARSPSFRSTDKNSVNSMLEPSWRWLQRPGSSSRSHSRSKEELPAQDLHEIENMLKEWTSVYD